VGSKEYSARHILVENEADAKAIIAQLKKGAKFDKLASEKSKDPNTKDKGGLLDWNPPSNYIPAIADSMKILKKGQVTPEPVKSPLGWHVIKLEDERPFKAATFEEVKPGLLQRFQQAQAEKLIADTRAKATIK